MFATAQKVARGRITKNEFDDGQTLILPFEALPERYSLRRLDEELASGNEGQKKEDELETTIVVTSCLSSGGRILREDEDGQYIDKLSVWLSKLILPDGTIVSQDEMPEDNKSPSRETALHATRLKGTLGLKALLSLQDLRLPPPKELPQPVLLSLLAFTSSHDPWTTPSSHTTAQLLLSRYAHQTETSEFITSYILQSVIRPLFSKSKPSAITSSGRKAMPTSAPPKRFEAADMDPSSKPWKYEAVYSVTVFRWAAEHASKEIIGESWPLFIPPLLTLLDDPTTRIRSQGLELLSLFLPKLNATMLAQTGLGEVFEDAVMPTLHFLPSITPIDESLALLEPAYQVLYVLGEVRYTDDEDGKKEKMKFLDRVLRQGVLMGYLHASEHVRIVEVLVHVTGGLVRGMGMRAVKHLKDIVPIISTVLTDPFGPSRPSLLLEATKTLQSIILNCWPRMTEPVHRVEIIKALALCWRRVTEDYVEHSDVDTQLLHKVKEELKVAGKLLVKSVEGEMDIGDELEPLIKADPGLREVFGLETRTDSG